MTQHKKGKVTANPEVIKLWGTNAGRARAAVNSCFPKNLV